MYINASLMNIYEYESNNNRGVAVPRTSVLVCKVRQALFFFFLTGSRNQVHQPKLRFLFLSSQSTPSISSPSSRSANRGTAPFHSLPLSSSSMLFCDALWSFALLHLLQERSALEVVIFRPAGRSPSRAHLMVLTLPQTYRGNLWLDASQKTFMCRCVFEMYLRFFTTEKYSSFNNPDGKRISKIKNKL